MITVSGGELEINILSSFMHKQIILAGNYFYLKVTKCTNECIYTEVNDHIDPFLMHFIQYNLQIKTDSRYFVRLSSRQNTLLNCVLDTFGVCSKYNRNLSQKSSRVI